LSSQPFEIIYLDMGNTLIYFDGSWQEIRSQSAMALADFFKSRQYSGIDWDDFIQRFIQRQQYYYLEREENYLETSVENILMTFLDQYGMDDLSPQEITNGLAAMYSVSQAHWHPEDDTIDTLEQLNKMGFRLGIISNAAYSLDVETLIDNFGIRPYFESILISADIGIRKPHPKIFQTALDRCGVQPKNALMVGDTLSADILGAKNAGMAAIWITRRADMLINKNFGATVTPDAVIQCLAELPGVLSAWQV
jgi:putative hydrolase of the HAD superfamily